MHSWDGIVQAQKDARVTKQGRADPESYDQTVILLMGLLGATVLGV